VNEELAAVRSDLALLEAELREIALISIGAFSEAGLSAHEVEVAAATIHAPSWGSWNGLIGAILSARRKILKEGAQADRAQVDLGTELGRLSELLESPPPAEAIEPAMKLASALKLKGARPKKLVDAFAIPIAARNRLVHGSASVEWVSQIAAPIRELAAWHSAERLADKCAAIAKRRGPWFVIEGGELWTMNGFSRDGAARYLSRTGTARTLESREAWLAVERLTGKTAIQRRDLERLLDRLSEEESSGVLLGDYLLGPPVAEGSIAIVHRGRQLSTGRAVALKVLRDGLPPETRARFQREAELLSRFHHEGIVSVLGFGEEPWSTGARSDEPWIRAFEASSAVKCFIALDWIEGRTLETEIGAHTREVTQKIELFARSAAALSAVHAAGLVHRDLKPANLMITSDGRPKLMDFGLARNQVEYTKTHGAPESPAYLSPEQLRAADEAAEIGAASDVYSLGASFYELFTGERIYAHDRRPRDEVARAKLEGAPPAPPRRLAPGLPWEIDALLLGALAADPRDRPSADALADDLERTLRSEPIRHRSPTLFRRIGLAYRRNRALSLIAAASVALFAFGVFAYVRSVEAEEAKTRIEALRAEENRAIADRRAKEAEAQLAAFYVAKGREELARSEQERAMAYFLEAQKNGSPRDLPLLLATTARALEGKVKPLEHATPVREARFDREEQLVYTVASDHQVRVFDAASGKRLAIVEDEDARSPPILAEKARAIAFVRFSRGELAIVRPGVAETQVLGAGLLGLEGSFAFDRAGTRLVAAGRNGSLTLFELEGGRTREILPSAGRLVFRVGFFAEDAKLFVVFEGGSEAVIDLDSGRLTNGDPHGDTHHLLGGPFFGVLALLSTSGARIIGPEGRAERIALEPVSSSPDARVYVTALAFSADGKTLLLGGADLALGSTDACAVHVVDVASLTRRARIPTAIGEDRDYGCEVSAVAISEDGTLVAAAHGETVSVFELASGARLLTIREHKGRVGSIAFGARTKTLLTASDDGTARITHLDQQSAVVFGRHQFIGAVHSSPDGERLLTVDEGDLENGQLMRTVRLFDGAGRVVRESSGLDSRIDADLSPDGAHYFISASDRPLAIHSTRDGALVREIEGARAREGSFVGADRLLTFHGESHLRLWSTKDWTVTGELEAKLEDEEDSVRNYLWARNDILIGQTHFGAVSWGLDGKIACRIRLPGETFVSMVIPSPDGRRAIARLIAGAPRLFDLEVCRDLGPIAGATAGTLEEVFSPDGELVAFSNDSDHVFLTRAEDNQALPALSGHESEVLAIAFDSTGSLLAAGTGSGRVQLWEMASRGKVLSLEHDEGVRHLAFSASGTHLVAAGTHAVRMFPLAGSVDDERIVRLSKSLGWTVKAAQLVPKDPE
jgi:serine/threonine protein kinase/WD40 repeat protein